MSYSNEFLRNFRPVFLAILKAQSFRPERVELVVIDEEQSHVFEPADAVSYKHLTLPTLYSVEIFVGPVYIKKKTEVREKD